MNIIELIKDAAFFGGHIPNERLDECRYFFDNVIEKQCIIPVVVKSFTEEEVVSEQRELLIAFHKWQQKMWTNPNSEITENVVDVYLKRNL